MEALLEKAYEFLMVYGLKISDQLDPDRPHDISGHHGAWRAGCANGFVYRHTGRRRPGCRFRAAGFAIQFRLRRDADRFPPLQDE